MSASGSPTMPAMTAELARRLATQGSGLAQDARSLDSLKRAARSNPQAAARQAAVQFQALFVQMVLKGMRNSSIKSGLFDSNSNETYTGMLDQQLALKIAGGSNGLTEVITRQLSRNLPKADGAATVAPHAAVASAVAPATSAVPSAATTPGAADLAAATASASLGCSWFTDEDAMAADADVAASPVAQAASQAAVEMTTAAAVTSTSPATASLAADSTAPASAGSDEHRAAFVARLKSHALVAQQLTGIPAHFILGQAALETGWGQHVMHAADGSNSHNFFGIKAGADWKGRTVDVATTEYSQGVSRRVVQKFRAYSNDAEGFRDWAKLVAGNPRYAGVVRHGRTASGFAYGLQQAGYATDPAYGSKLMHAISSIAPHQTA